jgi:hypothetical protein
MTAFTGPHGIPVTPSRRDGAQVRRWRRAQLLAAGYDELSARRLVNRADLDLHALLDQRERSSSPATSTHGDEDRNHG